MSSLHLLIYTQGIFIFISRPAGYAWNIQESMDALAQRWLMVGRFVDGWRWVFLTFGQQVDNNALGERRTARACPT